MVKNLPVMQKTRVRSLDLGDPWSRKWQRTPVFLPGEYHGQRSLVGYSPWGRKELDMTKQLTHIPRLLNTLEPPQFNGTVAKLINILFAID